MRAFLCLCLLLASTASAQSWPNRPLRMIVAQGPGSAPDVVGRFIGERLARVLEQSVVVDNRVGGDGVIGTQAVARAAPDGYTVLFAVSSQLVTHPATFKSLPYDPERDFASIGMVGISPLIITAHPEVKARSIAELVALAKAEPEKLVFSSPGRRRLPGMIGDMLMIRAGIRMLHVPYQGAGGIQDTLAGRTHLTIQGIPAVAALVRRGQLRALGVSSGKRLPGLEDVPAIAETLPGFDHVGWMALVAPAGVPVDVIRRLNRDLDRIVSDAEVVERLRALGIYPDGAGTPEALDGFAKRERAGWAKVVKELGIEPE